MEGSIRWWESRSKTSLPQSIALPPGSRSRRAQLAPRLHRRSSRAGGTLAWGEEGSRQPEERFAHIIGGPIGLNVLRVKEPYKAFVTVARVIYGEALRPGSLFGTEGVAPTATVHPSARWPLAAMRSDSCRSESSRRPR